MDFDPDARIKRISDFTQIFNVTAYRLQDMVGAMDTNNFVLDFRGRISKYEKRSIQNNEGVEAVQFWKRVNDLTDYSHLFEDMPEQGGTKQGRSILNAIRDTVGGLMPGVSQPA